MKRPPKFDELEKLLQSSRLVADGFLGRDKRPLREIIETDLAELEKLGFTAKQTANRMQQLSNAAKTMLANPIRLGGLAVTYEDYKGTIVCPWPHPGRFAKAITTVQQIDTGKTIKWSDLNIHMIAEHSFFEGIGSTFRIEPSELIKIIFTE